MNKILLFLFLISQSVIGTAATISATCSDTDINAKIASATAGDIIQVGTCSNQTWTNGVNVNKAVTVRGTYSGVYPNITYQSNITGGGIYMGATGAKVEGFNFTNNGVNGFISNAENAYNWRIFNNQFSNFTNSAMLWVLDSTVSPPNGTTTFGVLDHNKFNNITGEAALVHGPCNSWKYASSVGGAGNLFFENNTFTSTTSAYLDNHANSRTVWRYNTFTNVYPDGHGLWSNIGQCIGDSGNYNSWTGTYGRGVRSIEFYNNTITSVNDWRIVYPRGGTGVIFGNRATMASPNKGSTLIMLYEGCALFRDGNCKAACPSPSVAPLKDQIGRGTDLVSQPTDGTGQQTSEPMLVWDNLYTSDNTKIWMSPGEDNSGFQLPCSSGSDWSSYIVSGRDFCLGTGSQNTVKPTSCNGQAVTYTPYTYPHPLAGGVVDTDNPVISMTAPTAGATVGGSSVTISANATDATSGVSQVEFYYGGTTLIGIDTTATGSSYSVSWDTTGLSNGSYSLTAKAIDGASNSTTTSPVSVTVYNAPTAPSITTQPTAQTASAGGTATFTVVASGTVPLTYQWKNGDGSNVSGGSGATTASYTTPTLVLGDNARTYYVTVTNGSGSVDSNTVMLTVTAGPSPIAAYNLNENTGTSVADATGNGWTGTRTGDTAWTTGRNSYGINFNAVAGDPGGYVNIGSRTLPIPFTLSAWVNSPMTSQYQTFFSFGANRQFSTVNNQIVYYNGTGTTNLGTLASGWHHVAYVYNGTTLSSYVDGALSGTAQTVAITSVTGNTYFGAWADTTPGDFLTGIMDDIRIYNTALTQSQIQSDMNTPVGGSTPDVTPPTISSRTIPSIGTTVVIGFDEATITSGRNVPTLTASGGAATLSYSSGSGTSTTVYSLSRTINQGETVTMSYSQPGNGTGIEDSTGNDLASFSTQSVTNNSIQGAAVAPTITIHPQNVTKFETQYAVFTITATGTAPLSYQWKRNGVNVGTNSTTYTTPTLAYTDNNASYTCVVTNSQGSATSNAATLTVKRIYRHKNIYRGHHSNYDLQLAYSRG